MAALSFARDANLRHRFDSVVVSRHNTSVPQLFVPHRETNISTAFSRTHPDGRHEFAFATLRQ